MQKVFVLDRNKKPLMPCHPARARELLKNKKAAVYRRYPFTIILLQREGGDVQDVELKVDPGSRVSGIALTLNNGEVNRVIWGANLIHRGLSIKKSLESRRAIRGGRRFRKTRYRKPRFDNRTRSKGWLPPSIRSRVDNVKNWGIKLQKLCPISSISVETVRFDMQKLQNPEVSGVDYQRGSLFGYEVREYLLEKWGRLCAYCGAKDTRLEIDHITPKSKGGSNRVSNLVVCCRPCNEKKSNRSIDDFLKGKPEVLKKIKAKSKRSLADATAVNAARYTTGHKLKSLGLPVGFFTGGQTKFNRTKHGLHKDHWIDAACVGDTGFKIEMPKRITILEVKATGRGCRQMCRVNKYGFPRTSAKKNKIVRGFKTGDIVKAVVPKGARKGTHKGRVAVRSSGNFNIKTNLGTTIDISWKYCRLKQFADGFNYNQKEERDFLPSLKKGVSVS